MPNEVSAASEQTTVHGSVESMTIDIPLSIEKKSEDEDCEEVENEDERGVIDDDDTPTLLPKGSSKPTPTLTPTPTPTLVPKFIPVWDCLCRGGDDDAPTYQTHIIQTLTGSAIIFAIERSIWAFGEYIIHSPVPSAPLGMMFIFIALFASHTVAPHLTDHIDEWFSPAITELLKLVPLFFSPPLVQLPLALAPLPTSVVLKMFAVVISGSLVGVAATGITIQRIWGNRGGEVSPHPPPSSTATIPSSASTKLGGHHHHLSARTKRITMACGVVGMCATAAVASGRASIDVVLIMILSAAALQVGDRLPAPLKLFFPSIITTSALTCAGVVLLGLLRGVSALDALRAYRTGSGGVFGGSGVGDWLFVWAPAVVVALGFRLFEQRDLLARHLPPIVGGSALNCLLSLSYTLAACRLLQVPAPVSRSLVPRFISLPFAVPLAAALHGLVPLAALATCIQGPLASAFGFRILDACGVRGILARGVAVGGTAHALGTAMAAAVEPADAPAAALAFLLSGSFMSLFFLAPLADALSSLLEN